MTLSLDAATAIDILNGVRTLVRAHYQAARVSDAPLVMCVLAYHEVAYGAAISSRPERQAEKLARLVGSMAIEPFTVEDAQTAAEIRSALKAAGRPIGTMDALIGAQALARGWTMVTANTREFRRISGLKVLDWTRPDPELFDEDAP